MEREKWDRIDRELPGSISSKKLQIGFSMQQPPQIWAESDAAAAVVFPLCNDVEQVREGDD